MCFIDVSATNKIDNLTCVIYHCSIFVGQWDYFYIINTTIHQWLEIWNLFLVLNRISYSFALLTCEISSYLAHPCIILHIIDTKYNMSIKYRYGYYKHALDVMSFEIINTIDNIVNIRHTCIDEYNSKDLQQLFLSWNLPRTDFLLI